MLEIELYQISLLPGLGRSGFEITSNDEFCTCRLKKSLVSLGTASVIGGITKLV